MLRLSMVRAAISASAGLTKTPCGFPLQEKIQIPQDGFLRWRTEWAGIGVAVWRAVSPARAWMLILITYHLSSVCGSLLC